MGFRSQSDMPELELGYSYQTRVLLIGNFEEEKYSSAK
jgi:hypothetical protein